MMGIIHYKPLVCLKANVMKYMAIKQKTMKRTNFIEVLAVALSVAACSDKTYEKAQKLRFYKFKVD